PAGGHPFRGTYTVNATQANVIGYETRDVAAKGRIDWPTITVDGRAAGYGGRATAKGTIRAASPLQLDLTGKAEHVDLRTVPPQLNAPGVPSNLQIGYTLTRRDPSLSGTPQLEESTLADATNSQVTNGSSAVTDGEPHKY